MKKLMLSMCVIVAFTSTLALAQTQVNKGEAAGAAEVSKGEAIGAGALYGAILAADGIIAVGVWAGAIVGLAIYEAHFPSQASMAKDSILKPNPNSNTVSLSQ